MLNSLSAELNILRSSLFETALEVVAHNLNHKNNALRFFEFGKSYGKDAPGNTVNLNNYVYLLREIKMKTAGRARRQPLTSII